MITSTNDAAEGGRSCAVFSDCTGYRFWLSRQWDESKGMANFLMLNPSTADENRLDPTLRRCMGFAKQWGYGSMVITNICALRSTDPLALYRHTNPIGQDNLQFIRMAAALSEIVVCGWGNHGAELRTPTLKKGLGGYVLNWLRETPGLAGNLSYLALTLAGEPGHPLYLRKDLTPQALISQA